MDSESVFTNTNEHHIITEDDYIPNAGMPFDLDTVYNMAIYGRSRSGKGVIMARLLQHYYLFKIAPENIFIFSASFKSDKSFQSVRNYLKYQLGPKFDKNIQDVPDMSVLNDIIKNQYEAMQLNDDVRYRQIMGTRS